MDMESSNASLSMDTTAEDIQLEQQLGLLRALQAAEMGEHGGGLPPHILHEMNMLGMDPNDAESMQALFQMMAQQEQENARPDEHYLTIAQNGKDISDYQFHGRIMFLVYCAVHKLGAFCLTLEYFCF
jgi:hypothetical protein